jgi:AcrR family transcriptional regulator
VSRRRSTRALNNDEAIRDAAVKVVLSAGIDSISFRDVGREAGLTHGALYARFEDVEELLVDLWNGMLRQRAIQMIVVASEAASNPSRQSVESLIAVIREATPADVATVQVLFASRRFLILHEEVEGFIHGYLESDDTGHNDAIRSRTLILFSLITIMILANDQFGIDDDCLDFLGPILATSLTVDPADVSPVELHGSEDRVLPLPRNEIRAKLAYHTFGAVGRSGYSKATISRISRRAGYSPGAIYKLYPSKEDLVIAAVRNLMQAPWITISSLANLLDEGALAQLLYSSASEENSVRKSFTLEIAAASAHSEKIRSAVQAQLQGLEALVPLITGVSDDEAGRFACFIRSVVLLTLGVSFLSTVTKATDQVDFNQFTEPLRLEVLRRGIPSWSEIRRQLDALAGASLPSASRRT